MPDDNGVVRRIAWKQVCPWLLIFRSFRIAISLPVLLLAVLGVLLTPLGWWAAEALFVTDADLRPPEVSDYVRGNSAWPATLERAEVPVRPTLSTLHVPALWRVESNHVIATYRTFTTPFARLLQPELSITQAAYLLFGGIWNILVWALFGGAITRLAAVQLGREERLGLGQALKHVKKNYVWYVLSPLFPLLGLVLTALPVLCLGALMRLDVGVVIAGVLWPLALVAGLIMVIFLIGVMFGWPLMLPTISCEAGSDAFEAFSRSFSYTYQRPLHYLFYAVVTVLFGGFCWVVVSLAAGGVVGLAMWAASWGAGSERMFEIASGADGAAVVENGVWLIRSCNAFADVVVVSFSFAFFWCGATAVYLLLRRDTDQVDLDEVFLDEGAEQYGLPPLKPAEKPEEGGQAHEKPAADKPHNGGQTEQEREERSAPDEPTK